MSRLKYFTSVCTGALGLLALGGHAAAAEETATVSELVVTAQKVEQRVQDVPLSIAVFNRAYFDNTRTVTFEDVARATPGLIVNESVGASYTNVSVRGIGSDALNPGVEPSVGVFVDGVYQARPAFLTADLFDVERVEVLRGPQGALYGKNTDAGAINVISRAPTDQFEGRGRLYVGDYNALNLQAAVSGPISDRAKVRLSAYSDTRDPYIRNTISNAGGDEFRRYGARARLDLAATDKLDLSFSLAGDSHRSSLINYGVLKSSPTLTYVAGLFGVKIPTDIYARRSAANFAPHERLDQLRASVTATYDLGHGATLTSITAAQGFSDNNNSDVDYTPLKLLDGGAVTSQRQYSQEFRINNDAKAQFSYILGAFVFHQTQKNRGFNTVFPDLTAITGGAFPAGAQDLETTNTRVSSAALFGQASYRFTDQFSATLGVRYDDQRNRQHRIQPQGVTIPNLGDITVSKSESNVSGSFSLRYAFSPDLNGYATVSRGYKGGGYNGFGVGSLRELSFDPEEATNYEVGLKGSAFAHRLRFDATIFKTKLTDLQVSNFDGVNFIVGNAAAATTQGVEASLSATPISGLNIDAALSYDEATYDRYPGAPCTAAQSAAATGTCVQDLAGRTIANAPKLHGSLALQYEHDLPFDGLVGFGRMDYAYLSRQYLETALAPETLQAGYGLLNGRIGVRTADRRWGFFLTAANLTNTKYLRNAYDYPLFEGAYLAAPGQPRTWGAELQVQF